MLFKNTFNDLHRANYCLNKSLILHKLHLIKKLLFDHEHVLE